MTTLASTTPQFPSPLVGPSLVGGFASGLVLWTAWFVTHLPIVGWPESLTMTVLLVLWAAALAWSASLAPAPQRSWLVGLNSGAISALLGLLVLGSRITRKTVEQHQSMDAAHFVPNAGLITLGFITTGVVLGALMGAIVGQARAQRGASASPPAPRRSTNAQFVPLFALICVLTTAPLLFIGGLVTSTNAGMAVPDWLTTYGTAMFLYPLGPHMQTAGVEEPQKIYLEHSHRLFGTLVGLCSLTLMIWALRTRTLSTRLKLGAVGIFLLVLLQGVLGGVRVLQGDRDVAEDNRWYAMAHGILGQVTFAAMVALTVFLWPTTRAWLAQAQDSLRAAQASAPARARAVRVLATATLHASILQLVLGAAFRHFRHWHILWTHIAFAFVVLVVGVLAGFLAHSVSRQWAAERTGEAPSLLPALDKLGVWLAGILGLQFVLGWVALLAGNTTNHEAQNAFQAIARTLHQANGAAMLALITALYCVVLLLVPKPKGLAKAASAPAQPAGA